MKLKLTIVAEFEVTPDLYLPNKVTESDILRMEQEQLKNEGELNYLGILTDNATITSSLEPSVFECKLCYSKGFKPSVTGKGCTFCDGAEGGNAPEAA